MYMNYVLNIALPFSVFPPSLPNITALPFSDLSRILSPYPFLCSLSPEYCLFFFPEYYRHTLFCVSSLSPEYYVPFQLKYYRFSPILLYLSLSSEIFYKNTTSVSVFHFLKYFLKYSVFSLPIFIVIPIL